MHPAWILAVAVLIVLGGILILRLHAFLALLLAALAVALLTPPQTLSAYAHQQVEKGRWTEQAAESFARSTAPARVAEEFGRTCGKIGILIAMASIIGKCLLDSGAADRIVRTTLRLFGEPRAPVAFLGSGFLLGIPVFFDTVFYLMMPLGKAMRLRTGGNYLLYVLTIVAGATMAHSLVPPTPGPLFVAEQLQVNLATMIAAGCVVGFFSSGTGYLFALWANRRIELPLRESPDFSEADMEAAVRLGERDLPPVWLSLSPIVLPVVLIAGRAGLDTYLHGPGAANRAGWLESCWPAVDALGDKNVALMIAVGVALVTLAWQKRRTAKELATAVQTALAGGGIIILITSAGGAFGGAVRQCGVAEEIASATGDIHPLLILPLAFLVTASIRTAQGSGTVAMMTAVSVLGHFAENGQLAFHPVYLALAIGCGSKPIAWMNDSGFWVICKMSGMTEVEGLKAVTPMTALMGLSGLIATVTLAWLIPLV